jgi:uracil phosphoribosyltransferase
MKPLPTWPPHPIEIETPLETMTAHQLKEKIGLIPILRAGLGMVEGIWELMPSAEVWHIGLYRDEHTCSPLSITTNSPWTRAFRSALSLTQCWQRAVQPQLQPIFSNVGA